MKNNTYGYVRVSSRDQNTDRQYAAFRDFGIPDSMVYTDRQSGKDFERPGYKELLRKLKPGDTLVIKSIDRLGRNYEEILSQWRKKGQNANKTLTFGCYTGRRSAREVRLMFKILVVEDDRDLNKTVCSFLNQSGYKAVGCLDANEAYDALYANTFDCIVSDIMMPGIDGFEFAKTVRSLSEDIPILFMTARDDFASKQRGYRIGIDDYMVKPIDLDELFLRIGALLRRAKIASSHRLEIGALTLDMDERTALWQGEAISLTTREFNILYKLLSYPGKTFTRTQLMDEFWDADTNTAPRAVDVYMTKLRDKFSRCDVFEIVTVHGLGYKAVVK